MRWILQIFLLTSLCFCGLRRAVEATDVHAEAFWRFVPGEQSRSLEHLDPVFKEKSLQILRDLEREGYTVAVTQPGVALCDKKCSTSTVV